MAPEEETHEFAREVGRGLAGDALPAYADMLAAYHRAHSEHLRSIIAALPIQGGERILDMACGDGCFTLWLAERTGVQGTVVGADIAPAFLKLARQRLAVTPYAGSVDFQQASIDQLPFTAGSFDLVWCAQSLYSLPDPVAALHALAQVVRPGGTVAVLENDTLHHILLPWPPELELAVRQAQLRSLAADYGATGKFFAGRNFGTLFAAADLNECVVVPFSTTRRAPLSADERRYLLNYVDDLRRRTAPYLEPAARRAFDLLLDPQSPTFMFDQAGFHVTYLDLLAYGKR